jgi:IS30 family transposase
MVSGRKTGSTAALSVLEERKARYTCLRKIPNMKPENNTKAVVSMGQRFRKRTSITYDNGIENRRHEEIAFVLRVKNFFCNSYHSWEKGSVENTIGRIRRFIPKGADINQYSDSYIAAVEHWLNHTPRKCLEFQTPYEIMAKNLLFISPHPSGAFEG